MRVINSPLGRARCPRHAPFSRGPALLAAVSSSTSRRLPAASAAQPAGATGGERSQALSRRATLLSHAAAAALLLPHGSAPAEDGKRRNLDPERLKTIIAHDFQTNQYYITGRLDSSIFTSDCVFVDPTTRVQGVGKYSSAVAALFDQASSRADLISIEVTGPRLITAKWRFAAYLHIPGKPRLKPYTGSTEYRLNGEGLVAEHVEDWDISLLDAYLSIIFPSFGAPPAPPVEHPVDL